jgi:2-methylcitrate dehydratase PrpD
MATSRSPAPRAVSPHTAKLAAYIAAATRRALPPAVVEKTKHHLLDTLAAMVSGSRLAPGELAISYARTLGGPREASIAGTRLVVGAQAAALANGMLAHADETDDSHQPSFHHPGCAVVPAALAMAERERATGAALLRAVALGYDVGARVNYALGAMDLHLAGHSTHSIGPLFGAAAAAGALAGLDATRARHLLSYAAQQASGVSCWMRDPEHIEKAFDFGGMPASHGYAAAAMVAHGYTGVADVFSGERNFLSAFAPDGRGRRAALAERLGSRHEILHANIKKWPVGSPIQAALDATQALVRAHGLRATEVARVVVEIQDHEAAVVDDRDLPDICLQHLVAVMLLDGDLSFASSHDVARMRDPAVRALRRRIELRPSAALTRAGGRQAIVTIATTGGRRLRHHTPVVHGTWQNPMTRAEIAAKSSDLLGPVLGRRRARALIDAVWTIERVRDVRALRPLLRG